MVVSSIRGLYVMHKSGDISCIYLLLSLVTASGSLRQWESGSGGVFQDTPCHQGGGCCAFVSGHRACKLCAVPASAKGKVCCQC
jgi:hypothetical protein